MKIRLRQLRALKDEKYATSGFEGWLWETFSLSLPQQWNQSTKALTFFVLAVSLLFPSGGNFGMCRDENVKGLKDFEGFPRFFRG
jgi:hypothetical protein